MLCLSSLINILDLCICTGSGNSKYTCPINCGEVPGTYIFTILCFLLVCLHILLVALLKDVFDSVLNVEF